MRKIRLKTTSDTTLVKRCEKEIGGGCSAPEWKDHDDLDTVEPASDVVAIIVDMHDASGVLYIHDAADDYKDMIGMDFKGSMVVVPWARGLKFICYGPCRVGTIRPAEVETPQKT